LRGKEAERLANDVDSKCCRLPLLQVDVPSGHAADSLYTVREDALVPSAIIAVRTPKRVTHNFSGRTYLVGRHVPPEFASAHGMPSTFSGTSLFVELSAAQSTLGAAQVADSGAAIGAADRVEVVALGNFRSDASDRKAPPAGLAKRFEADVAAAAEPASAHAHVGLQDEARRLRREFETLAERQMPEADEIRRRLETLSSLGAVGNSESKGCSQDSREAFRLCGAPLSAYNHGREPDCSRECLTGLEQLRASCAWDHLALIEQSKFEQLASILAIVCNVPRLPLGRVPEQER